MSKALILLLMLSLPAQAATKKKLTLEDCVLLRNALATYGEIIVTSAAIARGYTLEQLAYARRACGV